MTREPPVPVEDPDGPTFEAPWQARAFAIAVAYCAERGHDFAAFQDHLIQQLSAADTDDLLADVEGGYYECWLAGLETFLVEEGALEPAAIDDRQRAFAAGERDASEFVVEDS